MSGVLFHEQTARQRIAALADAGSFVELLAPPERITSPYLAQLGIPVSFDDGIVIGHAKIGGKKVYLAAQVGQFVGGAVGEIHGAKLTGLFKAAARDRVPCILLVESGGVRLHEGSAGEIAIAETMRAIFECRALKVPTIAVIATDIGAYGGIGILSTCCDHRIMTEHGRLGISGPIVIEKWMGKKAYNSADRALVWKTSGGKTKYLLGDADALVHDAPEAVRDALTKLIGKSKPVNLGSVKARQKELQNRLKRFGATDDPNVVWKGMGVRNIEAASLASGPEFAALAKRGK
ncbi:biotin-independent malonate decarboxylase subunit beta [Reyranella aquatilis]|jgi:malonate decarboxylase beta subunit|uniref:Biotin-independent malonate decarboxylase subunit beta n=1 Tax=Reyranella aquatilis TaxID=2035356 RepID=A0ABS8KNN3_9HYPH|nr:biotin-independent malonate decarboxylase subunit beta [Reyranella aquatilis]MCC8427655.1 biotin-independent malonate decarboxylase subunit beta [Reyranella aquatilis]